MLLNTAGNYKNDFFDCHDRCRRKTPKTDVLSVLTNLFRYSKLSESHPTGFKNILNVFVVIFLGLQTT